MKTEPSINDDDLPLDKILRFPFLSIVVKSVFQNESK